MSATPDPAVCALFLLVAFTLAGTGQAIWLSLPYSRRFAWPLDGGRRLRGRRIFGDNKTFRGFLVMLPITGLAFVALALAADAALLARLWPLSLPQYGALGLFAAIGCMAGELPNSFVKRQLDIAPGEAARGNLRRVFLLIDRLDSPAGALAFVALAVPVPWATALYVLGTAPVLHGALSLLAFRLGGKARAA